jgi:hypothetical protein
VSSDAPRFVRIAGVLVGLQALTGLAFVVALVVRALTQVAHPGSVLAEAGYFLVISAGVLAAAIGLIRGRRWARTPAVVVQLLLLGVSWYVFGGSGQHLIGVLLAVFCVAVLVLLFTGRARAWSMRTGEGADSQR